MKLPRWLVIAMLTTSVLAVLAAAGWWWVTWPERTAREFVERFALAPDDRSWREFVPDAYDLKSGLELANFSNLHRENHDKKTSIESWERRWSDLVFGRATFFFAGEVYGRSLEGNGFTAERGTIHFGGSEHEYLRRHTP